MSVTVGADVAGTLAESDLRDLELRLRLAAWREGYRLGREHGRTEGYAQAEADLAAAWCELAAPIAHPERFAAQRITAARAGERRDAAEHQRSYVARAHNTPSWLRTVGQGATVYLFPRRPA